MLQAFLLIALPTELFHVYESWTRTNDRLISKYRLHTTLFFFLNQRAICFGSFPKFLGAGFEPAGSMKYLPMTASLIFYVISKAKGEFEMGLRIEDLHLFSICIETLPLYERCISILRHFDMYNI
jgi:hypothetical protein